jgi:hypothetical protein
MRFEKAIEYVDGDVDDLLCPRLSWGGQRSGDQRQEQGST